MTRFAEFTDLRDIIRATIASPLSYDWMRFVATRTGSGRDKGRLALPGQGGGEPIRISDVVLCPVK